jgi:hypothetical protein
MTKRSDGFLGVYFDRIAMSSRQMTVPSWDGISEPGMREILRQAEKYLDNSLKVAVAADQRATTLMGIYGAVGVALLVSAATLGTRPEPDLSIIGAITVMAVFLLVAGLLCGLAGKPIDFYVSGYEPEKIVESSTDQWWLLRYVCEDLQRRIDVNKQILQKSSWFIFGSFAVAGSSVLVGIIVFVVFRIMSLS